MKTIKLKLVLFFLTSVFCLAIFQSCDKSEIATDFSGGQLKSGTLTPADFVFVGEGHNAGLAYVYQQLANGDAEQLLDADMHTIATYANVTIGDFLHTDPNYQEFPEEINQMVSNIQAVVDEDPTSFIYQSETVGEFLNMINQSEYSEPAKGVIADLVGVFDNPDFEYTNAQAELQQIMEAAVDLVEDQEELSVILASGQVGVHSLAYWNSAEGQAWLDVLGNTDPNFKLNSNPALSDVIGGFLGMGTGALVGSVIPGGGTLVGAIFGAYTGAVNGSVGALIADAVTN